MFAGDRHDLLRCTKAGVEFILTFGALLVGGLYLDGRLGTMPAFSLVGGIGGFVLALYRLIRLARTVKHGGADKSVDDSAGD